MMDTSLTQATKFFGQTNFVPADHVDLPTSVPLRKARMIFSISYKQVLGRRKELARTDADC